jgi:hypothetical protein
MGSIGVVNGSALDFHFPSPALPGSGSMGMISARYFQAPLMIYNANVSLICDNTRENRLPCFINEGETKLVKNKS